MSRVYQNTYSPIVNSSLVGGRLTLESGVSISSTDQTAKTTLYYTPHIHSSIGLYNTTTLVWVPYTFTERSLALGTLSSGFNYDVFIYSNAGTLTLAASVWTSNTARATAISLQDGVYVKTSDKSYRYLGTFRTTTTTTTEDSEAKRFLYNCSNQVSRNSLGNFGYADDSVQQTFSFVSLNLWAPLNGGTANKCEWVNGLTSTVNMSCCVFAVQGVSSSAYTGIGIDTTTGADLFTACLGAANVDAGKGFARAFTLGYHYISLNGFTTSANATTYYKDALRFGGAADVRITIISAQQNM